MIRVTVELVPFGVEKAKRTIATMEIVNDGTGDRELGNYVATIRETGRDPQVRHGRLRKFPRQVEPVWSLIGGFLKLWGHTKHPGKLLKKSPGTVAPNASQRSPVEVSKDHIRVSPRAKR